MKPIGTYRVVPSLPPELERLRSLAYNLRWSWRHDTIDIFRRIDADLWEQTGHNPVLMLGRVEQRRLEALSTDEAFLHQMEAAHERLDGYMADKSTWYGRAEGTGGPPIVAYFSAEFGVTECLAIFAGGLGILAGDHLKAASDLGVPLVGVGLLYQQGYFRQRLDQAGRQQELYDDNDFHLLPLERELTAAGSPLTVQVDLPGRTVLAQVWRAQVGRVPLYLLDTNIPPNLPPDRDITDQLYGGDNELRLKQELVLGIGGVRALEALGLDPLVYHMNEGHSAFLGLERIRRLMRTHGISFAEARAAASSGMVFTTHTPVPAGHDSFPPELVSRYFESYARELGLPMSELLALGRVDGSNGGEPFAMSVLALRLAAGANGVSALHGRVSRRMWQVLWPGVPEDEVPIAHITNGVHFQSWISPELNQLYDRYLGRAWRNTPADASVWARAAEIPPEELWRTHERRRERLIAFARRRLRAHLERLRAPRREAEAAARALNPGALTIGFARRFAGYKRAGLLLSDPARLARILDDATRPVQVIFAGKAHPRDEEGKEIIRRVIELGREERFRGRLVFLEDYDMAAARYLVQGSDVWLNTPRRPLEASGTSGMKANANAVLNLSTLDGWWAEAWDVLEPVAPHGGWSIGRGEEYQDAAEQDRIEAEALYSVLEHVIVPSFYDRGEDGVPQSWVDSMKAAITRLCPLYNCNRMVREYAEQFYLPAARRVRHLLDDGARAARALAAWETRVRREWPGVAVVDIVSAPPAELPVRESVQIAARVRLGALTPDDVVVQLLAGVLDVAGDIVPDPPVEMRATGAVEDSTQVYEAEAAPCRFSGAHGYTVRVLPRHPDLAVAFLPGLITWAR